VCGVGAETAPFVGDGALNITRGHHYAWTHRMNTKEDRFWACDFHDSKGNPFLSSTINVFLLLNLVLMSLCESIEVCPQWK
jgi:hypothetical protein